MTPHTPGALVLGGRFRLVRLLGEGGMGVVWEVADVTTQARFAIKFVREDFKSTRAARRLRREAASASAIQHPNIVRVHEVAEEEDGSAAIVMELLEGESLAQRIEGEGSQSVGQTCAILGRVASALRAANAAGIVHRDLKPDNIFLASAPDGSVEVRVLDFGIAKRATLPTESVTVTGTIMGTPHYMSPEQAAGEKDLDARTDVWSIAVIAFECLTARTPVTGDNYGQLLARLIRGEITRLVEVQPNLPADLIVAIDGALVPRERRPLDLAPMEATFARYADATIRRAAPRVVVQSDPSIPAAARSNESLVETIAADARGGAPTLKRGDGRRRGSFVIAIAISFAAVLVVGGGAAWVTLAREEGDSGGAARSAPAQSSAHATVEPSAAAVLSSAGAVTAATAAPSSAPAPSSSHRTQATHRPSATSAASAAPSASASAGPKRLQGGVAGEVPF